MSWLDAFMSNKAPIGFLLTITGTGLIGTNHPTAILWGQGLLAAGGALIGGGMLKSDNYHRESALIKQNGKQKEEISVVAPGPIAVIEQKPRE